MNWRVMLDTMERIGLSPREREVAWLYVNGAPVDLIAGTLFIQESTVRNHITNILTKAGIDKNARGMNGVRLIRFLNGVPPVVKMEAA